MSEWLINLLMFGLPAGFLGSVVSWMFGRQKRDNDFIAELQKSINLLAEENAKTLREVVELRRENAQLLANQDEMSLQMRSLQRENATLSKTINDLTDKLSKLKTIPKAKK